MAQSDIYGNCQAPPAGLDQIHFCVTGGYECSYRPFSFVRNMHCLIFQALNTAKKEVSDKK